MDKRFRGTNLVGVKTQAVFGLAKEDFDRQALGVVGGHGSVSREKAMGWYFYL